MIYYYRIRQGVAGTSASCPTFAGMVSLLNDQRMKSGKKSLGFLNQIFYKNPQLFTDITLGNTGWPAAAGWDATTGLGSPKFQELLSYVMSLP
jgi:tripeptidyl-peptidase-1